MRILLVLGTLLAAQWLGARPSHAQEYPWCAVYDAYTRNCGFVSFKQCLDTARGAGAVCQQNPRYVPPKKR